MMGLLRFEAGNLKIRYRCSFSKMRCRRFDRVGHFGTVEVHEEIKKTDRPLLHARKP